MEMDEETKQKIIAEVSAWRETKPFQPKEFSLEAIAEKQKKFQDLSDRLCILLAIEPIKVIVPNGSMSEESWNAEGSSVRSVYAAPIRTVALVGKFSITTFLGLFFIAIGTPSPLNMALAKEVFETAYGKSLVSMGGILVREDKVRFV